MDDRSQFWAIGQGDPGLVEAVQALETLEWTGLGMKAVTEQLTREEDRQVQPVPARAPRRDRSAAGFARNGLTPWRALETRVVEHLVV